MTQQTEARSIWDDMGDADRVLVVLWCIFCLVIAVLPAL